MSLPVFVAAFVACLAYDLARWAWRKLRPETETPPG